MELFRRCRRIDYTLIAWFLGIGLISIDATWAAITPVEYPAFPVALTYEVESSSSSSAIVKKNLKVENVNQWQILPSSADVVFMSRLLPFENESRGIEVLILDKSKPDRILASSKIRVREGQESRVHLKLENGEYLFLKLKAL